MEKKEKASISVILVNFHQTSDTLLCLKSLFLCSTKLLDLHIIVVDADSNEEKDVFSSLSHPKDITVDVIKVENNGFSGNNNAGILFAEETYDPDYYFLLNNDTTVTPTTLDELVLFYEEHKEASLLVPKIYFEKGYEFHKDTYTKEELGNVIWYAG